MDEKFELISSKEGKFLVVNESYFKINDIIYRMLELSNKEHDNNYIANKIQQEFNVDADHEQVDIIIRREILPLYTKKNRYINSFWYKKEILYYKDYEKLIKLLSNIFNPYLFWTSMLTLVPLNFLFLFTLPSPIHNLSENMECTYSMFIYLIILILIFIILLFHEMGHASSSYKFGIKSKSIGIGFYSFFPVFFTDITGIWILNRYKRIFVNLSGIYIQLIFSVFLYLAYYVSITYYNNYFSQTLLYRLLATNSFIIFINLFPFFKFDGYWLYSDLFRLPNLSKTYSNSLLNILGVIFPFLSNNKGNFKIFKSPPFFLFFIGKLLTNIFILYIIFIYLKSTFFYFKTINLDLCNIPEFLFKIVFLLILLRLIVKATIAIIHQIKKKHEKK